MSDLVKALRRYPKSEKVAHEAAARIEVLEALARGYDIAREMFTNRIEALEAALALVRIIVVSAEIEAGKDLSPTTSAAIAWRTISRLRQALAPEQDK